MKTMLSILGGVGLPLAGGVLAAQEPVTLGDAEAVYEESFSVVSTVREMPDGRVLVADALGQVLMRLDLDAGTADTLGRVGRAPRNTGSRMRCGRCQAARRCWSTSATAGSPS